MEGDGSMVSTIRDYHKKENTINSSSDIPASSRDSSRAGIPVIQFDITQTLSDIQILYYIKSNLGFSPPLRGGGLI